jgi:NADH-quinone oxidoreductase subunit G
MTEDSMVTIEVNGQELKAKAGAMLIDVTDQAGIEIPRFCYHNKLSVSANCRMCLVEVEKVPKPLPACATTVMDGMKVHTRSPMALAAQKGTMEFLLINHPLDCPICDQGGECELQDVSLTYGSDVTRFVENKRVVPKKYIGPLIETNFTRCIHCTRCVRFSAEIAGIREMGATGRGEYMKIGTYVENSIDSELSGNMIDICPVGSLTSKPFRYQGRAWEMIQSDSVAPHDAVGSNIHIHVRDNRVMRVHPRANETINECWISDRDRFSYQGLYSDDRLTTPMIKENGKWSEADWETALELVAKGLKSAGTEVGALVSPCSTVEEQFLAQKLVRGLGSDNIDFRLRQSDFRGGEPELPWLGLPVAEIENIDAALLIGANPRKDQPILGHRLRKAVLNGASISYINPLKYDLNYRAQQLISSPAAMVDDLAAVAKALGVATANNAEITAEHQAIADQLKQADSAVVLLGNLASAHPDYSILSALAAEIAQASGAKLGFIAEAANSTGARLVGAVPKDGLNAQAMLEQPCKGYLLLGLEPDCDLWNPAVAAKAFEQADFVVAMSTYKTASLESAADVLLPMAGFAETSGTYVNAEGTWQSFTGAVTPMGEARPAWKILRVLGNLLDVAGFDQVSSLDVLEQAQQTAEGKQLDNTVSGNLAQERMLSAAGLTRIGDVPIYATDALVRRAPALQQTADAIDAAIRINPSEAAKAGLADGDQARVVQDGMRAILPVEIDPGVADGSIRVCAALAGSESLGGQFGEVTLEKA